MANDYVRFRIHLARHGLQAFVASLKSAAEIVLLIGANVLLGLFALSAFPTMLAAQLPLFQAVPLLCAHALLMAIPGVLLRKRVLPQDVVQWCHRLPVATAVQLRADALVALMLAGPLALLYLVSTLILLWQGPPTLAPARGIAGTVCSLLMTYAATIAVLTLRGRRAGKPLFRHRTAPGPVAPYRARRVHLRLPYLWLRLFWLPFWRAENVVGWQQSALLAAGLGSAAAWMQAPAGIARGVLALLTSMLMVLLADRGDKAVREQSTLLRPVLAAWPIRVTPLFALARGFAALPPLLVMVAVVAGGARHGLWLHTAGRLWLLLACAAPLLLVATPLRDQRARVTLVVISILLLTATGSELWQ
ncbi:MAG TPA: hypothetical protein VGC21_25525 [Telluria sp.]